MGLPNVEEARVPGTQTSGYPQHAAINEVSSVLQTAYGTKYLIVGRIVGPTGDVAEIRSVWFVEAGESQPRLVTAYPLRGVKK